MKFFEGDLVSSRLALRNVRGLISIADNPDTQSWTGHFRISATNASRLANQNSYLLLLANGQSATVMLTQTERDGEMLKIGFETV